MNLRRVKYKLYIFYNKEHKYSNQYLSKVIKQAKEFRIDNDIYAIDYADLTFLKCLKLIINKNNKFLFINPILDNNISLKFYQYVYKYFSHRICDSNDNPSVVRAISSIVNGFNKDATNDKILIIGRGNIGTKLFKSLISDNFFVCMSHSKTSDSLFDNEVMSSDIVINCATDNVVLPYNYNGIYIDCCKSSFNKGILNNYFSKSTVGDMTTLMTFLDFLR